MAKRKEDKIATKISVKTLRPAPLLSREQAFMGDLFGSDRNRIIMSDGEENIMELNEMNGALTSGNGLINSGDNGRTGRFFGI